MKKILFTLLAIMTAGLVGIQAQSMLTVQGQVTDDSTGAPIAHHHILALSDTALMPGTPGGSNPGGGNPGGGQGIGFLGMAFTDAQGNYTMDIDLSMVNTSQVFVITNGCQLTPQIVALQATAGTQTVNFVVCQGLPGGNPGGGNPGGGNPGGGNPGGGNPGGGCPGGGNPGGGNPGGGWPGGGQPGMGCHAMFFGMPDTADLLTWHFHALSMSPTATFTWDLNGTTLSGQDVTTTFPAFGQYNVCLVMEDTAFNCADTFCMMVEVDSTWFPGGGHPGGGHPGGGNPGGGNPGGGWPGGGQPGMGCHAMFFGMPDTADLLTWHFHALSMSPTATFTWDLNGTTLSGQDVTTTFPAFGQYNVCLVMEDTAFNCADTFCMMVEVDSTWFPGGGHPGGGHPGGGNPGGGNPGGGWPGGGQPGMGCHAMFFGMPDTADLLTWHFHALSMSPTATFTWDLNGTTLSGQDVTTTFPAFGQYNVCLVMEDTAFNCADTFCMMVEVDSTWFPGGGHPGGGNPGGGNPGGGNPGGGMLNCNADFSYVLGNGGQVDFTDLSQPIPSSWVWDFGDGNSSTDQNPTHTYTVSGTYDVTLEISFANCLCTDSTAQTIVIPVSISATVGINEITSETTVGYPYPNPASDQTRIDVDFSESGYATVMLLDLSGKVIQSQETYLGNTMETLEVNTSNLDSGIYMLMIRHENGSSYTRKLTRF